MLQQFIRMAMNLMVSKGINAASRGGKNANEMSSDERRAAQSKRQNIGRVRQAANLMRRFMR